MGCRPLPSRQNDSIRIIAMSLIADSRPALLEDSQGSSQGRDSDEASCGRLREEQASSAGADRQRRGGLGRRVGSRGPSPEAPRVASAGAQGWGGSVARSRPSAQACPCCPSATAPGRHRHGGDARAVREAQAHDRGAARCLSSTAIKLLRAVRNNARITPGGWTRIRSQRISIVLGRPSLASRCREIRRGVQRNMASANCGKCANLEKPRRRGFRVACGVPAESAPIAQIFLRPQPSEKTSHAPMAASLPCSGRRASALGGPSAGCSAASWRRPCRPRS